MDFREAYRALVVYLIVVGFLAGFVVFVVLPWIWTYLKPWIHAATG